MLVLTRKLDQEIKIGDHVTVKVLSVRGGAVRLGIDAPASLRILRNELTASDMNAERPGQEDATQDENSPPLEWKASLARIIPSRPGQSESSRTEPGQSRKSLAMMLSRRRQQQRLLQRGTGL